MRVMSRAGDVGGVHDGRLWVGLMVGVGVRAEVTSWGLAGGQGLVGGP